MSYCRIYFRTIFLLLGILAFISGASAQNAGIEGKVLDDYGHPVQKAIVTVSGKSISATTDEDGLFTIAATTGDKLLIKAPGFYQKEFLIKNNKAGDIQLESAFLPQPTQTDVLYDTKPNNKILGSVSTVYNTQLSTTPASSYMYALPGRLAGLYTKQSQGFGTPQLNPVTSVDIFVGNRPNAGQAGAGPNDNTEMEFRLRGQTPVTMVDGVQRDLFSVDPSNIESVSVLKDALSTILLGQRSSRGVLYVTTKKSQPGAPRLSFTAETAFQEPLKLPNALPADQYAYLLNEALLNDGKPAAYTAADIAAYKDQSNPYTHPNVDWYNTILRKNSPMTRYNVNISGGKSIARYFVGLSYMDQQGMYRTTNDRSNLQKRRYNINSNVDIDVNKNFTVALQIFGRIQEGSQPGATSGTILDALLRTPSNSYPVYNPNGSFGGNLSFPGNLLAQVQETGYIQTNDRDLVANIDLKYKFDDFLPGLWMKAKGNLAIQSANALNRSKSVPSYNLQIGQAGDTVYTQNGQLSAQNNSFVTVSNARIWFAQVSAGYDKTIGKNNFGVMLLADQRRTTFNYDLPGTSTNIGGKVTYDYDGKYMLEAAVVNSGYDRYRPGHKYGIFYATGGGWNMARENFIKDNVSWISQLKLRATYGQTGNGGDNSGYYIWRQTYSERFSIYGIGTSHAIGYGMEETNNTLANPNISWEKAHKFDVGIDAGFFKDKLTLTADYYHDTYYDLLQIRGKSIAIIGNNYPLENIGKKLYSGAEMTLTYQDGNKKFNYFITANGSLEKTKVIFSDEQVREYPWLERTGQPVNQPFGLTAIGFFQNMDEIAQSATIDGYTPQPGDIKYLDRNSDGKIDQFDVSAIGTTKPMLYYGLNAGFSFKGFQFSFLVQGVKNRNMWVDNSYTESAFQGAGQAYAQAYEQMAGRWIPENGSYANFPRLSTGGNVNNQNPFFLGNSFYLHSGDYWRLKTVYVGYTIPYSITNKVSLAGVTVFANAQNLFTWSAYDRVDPEVGFGAYPAQRVINFGINVKF